MTGIEPEIQALKDNLLDMVGLVKNQLSRCRKSLEEYDDNPAKEVLEQEKKVNALELSIDKDCENIIALHNPVATDLRFVLASLKINNDLERIGDNASSLAKFIVNHLKKVDKAILKKFELEDMLHILVQMMKDIEESMKEENTTLAHEVFKADDHLNKLNKKALNAASDLLLEFPDQNKFILRLFSIVRSLERAGDLTKNIGEEIIFHKEAKILRHKKSS